MKLHSTAASLIAANEVGTDYAIRCAHEATIRTLHAVLDEYRGTNAMVQPGCGHQRMILGDAEVLVEFEFEPEDGDGWELPHTPAAFTVIGVLINGVWCSAEDVVPASVIERWEVQLMEERAEDCQADEAEWYEERRAERAYG